MGMQAIEIRPEPDWPSSAVRKQRAVKLFQKTANPRRHLAPHRGWRDAPGRPFEELPAECFFKLADAAGQGGLGKVQHFRMRGENCQVPAPQECPKVKRVAIDSSNHINPKNIGISQIKRRNAIRSTVRREA